MGLLNEQPKRMAREKRLLEALARDERWLTLGEWSTSPGGELMVTFTLDSLPTRFQGVLVYPYLYPEVPAYIHPQRSGEAWSAHQYRSGVLCLERGADNWDPSVTGADLVRSANKLLLSEAIQAVMPHIQPVDSRHIQTLGQSLRGATGRFMVTDGFADVTARAAPGSAWPMTIRTLKFADCSVTRPVAVGADAPQPLGVELDLPGSQSGDGWVFTLSSMPAKRIGLAELMFIAAAAGKTAAELKEATVVVRGPQAELRAYYMPEDGSFSELSIIDVRAGEGDRLPAQYAKLAALRVAVVGLGSLGSKIAVSLARSGTRQFTLVDADVLLPQNLVRNDLDWRGVGFAKVDAVSERILGVAPDAVVLPLPFDVAGQENSTISARIAEAIASCDLVVDATANPDAFATLAAICKRAKVTMVWGEVFAGGFGALMARSRAGLDADALRVRGHVLGVMSSMQPVPRLEVGRYTLDADGRVMVAGDAEVSHLAAAMTAFAIDAVCGAGVSTYPVAAYLLGFEKFWEFKAPFDTIPIACPGPSEDGAVSPLTEDEGAALAELAQAVQGSAGAARDRSS